MPAENTMAVLDEIAPLITYANEVKPSPLAEVHMHRSGLMRKACASPRQNVEEEGRKARQRIASAIAGSTSAARLSVAKIANITGASVAEVETTLSDMEEDGVIIRRPTSRATAEGAKNRHVPALDDSIDIVTPGLLERLGATV